MDRRKRFAVQVAAGVVLREVAAVIPDEEGVVTGRDLRVNVYAQNAERQCHTNRESRAWKFNAPIAAPA